MALPCQGFKECFLPRNICLACKCYICVFQVTHKFYSVFLSNRSDMSDHLIGTQPATVSCNDAHCGTAQLGHPLCLQAVLPPFCCLSNFFLLFPEMAQWFTSNHLDGPLSSPGDMDSPFSESTEVVSWYFDGSTFFSLKFIPPPPYLISV